MANGSGFYRSDILTSQVQLRAFLAASFADAGYTATVNDSDYLGFKYKNNLMTNTDEGFFNPIFVVDGTAIGITTAVKTSPMTQLITKSESPKTSDYTTNFRVDLNVTPFGVAFRLYNPDTGISRSFACVVVDYRELEINSVSGYTTHFDNLKNNLTAIFEVGVGTPRILYAGTTVSQSVFNKVASLETPSLNPTIKLMQKGDGELVLPISTVAVFSENKYYGTLRGTFLTDTTSVFTLDKGVDQYGGQYISLRNSVAGRTIFTTYGGLS